MLYAARRVRDELDRLEQQQRARVEEEEELLAAAVEAEKAQSSLPHRVKPAMALALVNMRNRWAGTFVCILGVRACVLVLHNICKHPKASGPQPCGKQNTHRHRAGLLL
jgi:hypothetical protein